MGSLKESFRGVSMHAYTATAKEQIRRDIAQQIGLDEPEYFVGSFHRSNLVYIRPGLWSLRQVPRQLWHHLLHQPQEGGGYERQAEPIRLLPPSLPRRTHLEKRERNQDASSGKLQMSSIISQI